MISVCEARTIYHVINAEGDVKVEIKKYHQII